MDTTPSDREQKLARAKQPLTPLAGPYGHPIHPMLVTIPIGAWSSSLVFDALAAGPGDERHYAIGAKQLIDIGLVTAAGAALFGLLDFVQIPARTKAWYVGLAHLSLNAGALGLFALNSASRARTLARREPGAAITPAQRGMSLATVLALAFSGWIGGSLTYRFGVRVAGEQQEQKNGYSQELPRIDDLFSVNLHA